MGWNGIRTISSGFTVFKKCVRWTVAGSCRADDAACQNWEYRLGEAGDCASGRYFIRCFRANFYSDALPHFAKLGALRSAWKRLRPPRLVS